MRNLLALVGAAVLTFGGVGWYIGWYRLQPSSPLTPGHQSVNIDIDGRKIRADEKRAEQAVEKALEAATAREPHVPSSGRSTHQ
jgi:hypothetical protein